uniref:Oxidoreductase, molybdopterin binding n=1 Tax=Solibacter usitatus (strain Ellin6076) TaxID=234267 RepID=Q028W0_SOLUE
MTRGNRDAPPPSQTPERELRLRMRRAFLTLGVGAAAGFAGWRWLRSRPEIDGLAQPFRRMLQFNERVAGAYFDERHLAAVYPASAIQPMRTNGDIGLGDDYDPQNWRLAIKPLPGRGEVRYLTLADIRALPQVEHITQLKCIEGWSVVTHWAGARFMDFTEQFAPESKSAPYIGMQTPDEEYFVGLDRASAMHPQTLLCYEMNGAPLTLEHGAPLRLATPVKYGIKNLKRIGTITYSTERPNDYWAEQGYDWYAGM